MANSGRILIADDDETVLKTTAVLLGEEGFTCNRAQNAAQALKLLAERDYDLLIADWRMPGNAELELVRTVQQTRPGTPVIMVTGYPQLGQAMREQGIRIFANVIKPFEFQDFLKLVLAGIAHGQASKAGAQGKT